MPPENGPARPPTLKGSNQDCVTPMLCSSFRSNATPAGSAINPTLSGGVAPGYLIDPLRGSRLDGTGEFFRSLFSPAEIAAPPRFLRSEERRVGKECRSR